MYDLLIIGAGTAGMACAITAAQNGAKVGVIEKADHVGGALHWSGGHMSGGGTRRQKVKGIEDSPEDHFKDIMDITGGTGDVDLIKLAVEEAPKTIDWLDDLGFEFAPECPRIIYGHVPYTKERTQYGVNKAMSIYKVIKPLWDKEVTKGNIECFLEHSLQGLERTNGKYDTVVASSATGPQSFKGKAIVLTTGGYGSNPAYWKEKHPDVPLMSSTYPTATGDGQALLEKMGGKFRFPEFYVPSLGGVELEPGRCNFNEAWAMVLTSIYRQPREIFVNSKGKRFMPEDESNADTRERMVAAEGDYKFWAIFDENALLERDENGVENPIMIGMNTEQIKELAKEEKYMWAANSITQLAKKTGLPKKNLLSTINEFNRQITLGKDETFGRTYLKNKVNQAPYYALLIHASVLVTFGGITANKDLQLVDKEGNIMEGLFGAGEFLGLGATSGNAFCSGMAITPALSFGRILGRKLARKDVK